MGIWRSWEERGSWGAVGALCLSAIMLAAPAAAADDGGPSFGGSSGPIFMGESPNALSAAPNNQPRPMFTFAKPSRSFGKGNEVSPSSYARPAGLSGVLQSAYKRWNSKPDESKQARQTPQDVTLTSSMQPETAPAMEEVTPLINDAAPIVEEDAVIVDEGVSMPTREGWVISPTSPAPGSRLWSAKAEYLYWEATDPTARGVLYRTDSTSPTSPLAENFTNLHDPNTDNEMGVRAFLVRQLADNFSVEVGGMWVYPTRWLEVFQRQLTPGSAFNPIGQLDRVFFDPTNEELAFGNASYLSRYWGAEVNGRWHLLENRYLSADFVAGARALGYYERFAAEYQIHNTANEIVERFETDNHMVGGQIGGDARLALFEYISIEGIHRAGVMANFQELRVTGPPAGQGRLTNASNLGVADNTDATLFFELGASVVFDLTPYISLRLGYSGLWLSDQLRATGQIDLANAQVGGNPTASMGTNDIWIRGFVGSVAFRW